MFNPNKKFIPKNRPPSPDKIMPMTTPVSEKTVIIDGVAYMPVIQNGVDVIGTINNQVCWIRTLQNQRDSYQYKLEDALAELAKYKENDDELTVCHGNRATLRALMEEEGWTEGESEESIKKMVESAFAYGKEEISSCFDSLAGISEMLGVWYDNEEADSRKCVECAEDFTPSMPHRHDTVCDECVSEKGKTQVLRKE